MEHISDQAALPNLNANWVNAKGEFELDIDLLLPQAVPTEPVRTRWTGILHGKANEHL